MSKFIAACVQTNSSDDVQESIAQIGPLALEAVRGGATFLALPENAFAMRREGQKAEAYLTQEHPGVVWARGFCAQHNVWMNIGSIRAIVAGDDRPTNRSVMVDAAGNIAMQYDKIHLFDVKLPDGSMYEESMHVVAGTERVLAETALARMGMSICFDLRFAAHYRALAEQGAEVLLVPSAFTRPTGKAHWEILLRARAIENQAFVVAAGQCGVHPGGRETWGHSMIVDPWGEVLAQAGEEPGVIVAEIDLERVRRLRAQMRVF